MWITIIVALSRASAPPIQRASWSITRAWRRWTTVLPPLCCPQSVKNFRDGFLKYYAGRPGPKAVVNKLLQIVEANKVKLRYPLSDASPSILMRRIGGDNMQDSIVRRQFSIS